MTDQKQHDNATDDGMPELRPIFNERGDPRDPYAGEPLKGQDAPLPGIPLVVHSATALEVEVLHLRERLHAIEQAFMGFLTHEQGNHPAVASWIDKIRTEYQKAKDFFHKEMEKLSGHSTPAAQTETTVPSASGSPKEESSDS